jgi:hypothetical protein
MFNSLMQNPRPRSGLSFCPTRWSIFISEWSRLTGLVKTWIPSGLCSSVFVSKAAICESIVCSDHFFSPIFSLFVVLWPSRQWSLFQLLEAASPSGDRVIWNVGGADGRGSITGNDWYPLFGIWIFASSDLVSQRTTSIPSLQIVIVLVRPIALRIIFLCLRRDSCEYTSGPRVFVSSFWIFRAPQPFSKKY